HRAGEIIAGDVGAVGLTETDKGAALFDGGIGIVDHDGAAGLEGCVKEPGLPVARSSVRAKAILADIVVGGGEVLLGEGALAGSRQADQDDELHALWSLSLLRLTAPDVILAS